MLDEMDETTEMHMDALEGGVQQSRAYIGAKMVLDFEKQDPYRKIQLITCHCSAFERLLNFHSTPHVINLITYDWAYCLYPLELMKNRSLTYLRQYKLIESRIRDKYTAREFELVDQITREFGDPHTAFARGEHHVSDGRCLTLDILALLDYNELDDDEVKPNVHRPMEINSRELKYDPGLSPVMCYNLVGAPKLRFQDTLILDEDMAPDFASLILHMLPPPTA